MTLRPDIRPVTTPEGIQFTWVLKTDEPYSRDLCQSTVNFGTGIQAVRNLRDSCEALGLDIDLTEVALP